jgi:hypothetical protein
MHGRSPDLLFCPGVSGWVIQDPSQTSRQPEIAKGIGHLRKKKTERIHRCTEIGVKMGKRQSCAARRCSEKGGHRGLRMKHGGVRSAEATQPNRK